MKPEDKALLDAFYDSINEDTFEDNETLIFLSVVDLDEENDKCSGYAVIKGSPIMLACVLKEFMKENPAFKAAVNIAAGLIDISKIPKKNESFSDYVRRRTKDESPGVQRLANQFVEMLEKSKTK